MNADKEFVPYQPSLDMKSIGFNEPCLSYFDSRLEQQLGNFDFTEIKGYNESDSALSPLYQQAFRWFREKYGIEGVTQRAEDFMWYKWTIYQYNENGKNDFICTNAVGYYVRDNKLNAVVQMRSNDVVFGYKNDRAWAKYVLDMMVSDYNEIKYDEKIESGTITWNVMNLHVYERHFHLLKD